MNREPNRELQVNGETVHVAVEPTTTLLQLLRDQLQLTAAKPACEMGACGACTVLVGDRTVLSCVTLALLVDGPVRTLEGLRDELCGLREAFADRGGFQCGYCTPGQLIRAYALQRSSVASAEDVAAAMSGNICRCTGYQPIVQAVLDVLTAEGRDLHGESTEGCGLATDPSS